MVFKFDEPITIIGYRFMTGEDCPHRDPGKWTVTVKMNDEIVKKD